MSSEWTVFAIRHGPSGVAYYARARSMRVMWNNFRSKLERQVHRNEELQAAWDFYGPCDFEAVELAAGLTESEAKELVGLILEHAGGLVYNLSRSRAPIRRASESRSRRVLACGVEYPSLSEAARRLGTPRETLRRWAASEELTDYRYVNAPESERKASA